MRVDFTTEEAAAMAVAGSWVLDLEGEGDLVARDLRAAWLKLLRVQAQERVRKWREALPREALFREGPDSPYYDQWTK